MTVLTDVELAVAMLKAKAPYYDKLFRYYQGNQPLIYSSDRLKEIFGSSLSARFTQNWCAVVIDSVLERIQLQRITIADDENTTKQLDVMLQASDLTLEADDVHLAALVTGEAFVIVWPDEETNEPQAYYNDPRNVHIFYEADRPRIKRFACKWWIGDDGYRYLTLYYADRLEYYKSNNVVQTLSDTGTYSYNEVTNGKSFARIGNEGEEDAENPYGIIPVFHFRRERRLVSSELQNIIEQQDAVNKLLADMMIAAEFGAFPQRYVIGSADISLLKNAPNKIWDIPASDGEGQPTSVGQFEAMQLDNYLKAIDKLIMDIAIISRTPKHYFFGQGGDPSGEALIAMEAPLNHKAQKYIDRFVATWSEVAQFMLKLSGTEVDSNAIIPHFKTPETVQPYTKALIIKEMVAAGVPLVWQMKQEGYTEEEIEDLEGAVQEKQAQDTERLAQVMEQRQSNFTQNGARQNGQPPRAPAGARNSA